MFNWIDWIIFGLFVYELYRGWKSGFFALGITFISFALSLWVAILLRAPVSQFFSDKFGIASLWSTGIAYVGVALAGQMIFSYALSHLLLLIPAKIEKSKINNAFGAFVSGINCLTTVGFVLVLLLAIPMKGTIRADVRASVIGGSIVAFVETYGGPVKNTVDELEKTAAKFLTVDPKSNESVRIDVSPNTSELEVNDVAERALLELVNKERATAGAPALVVDVRVVSVARKHSKDMFMQRYFSHISKDGKTLGDRLGDGNIKFLFAGENLAYAPDVEMAHTGLMNSPEHKKNMLDPQFKHVGIGIISTTKYGMMVTEDFIN
jgi:uncharacterized protein YkwD